MATRASVSTPDAPQAIGPYSQAIRAGHFLFLSGQIPLDPHSGEVVTGDVRAQTRRVLDNISGVLDAAPARSTVQVSRLPRDVRVEIEAIALLP